MGKHLDLDDVAAGHPVAQRELDDLRGELRDAYDELRKQRPCVKAVFDYRVWQRVKEAEKWGELS